MFRHCTALAAAILLAVSTAAGAQEQPQPSPGDTAFAVFLSGTQIGREQVSLAKTDSGWIVTSNGRTAPPLDFTINRFEIKYAADWQPLEMTLESHVRTMGVIVRSSFTMTTAINEIAQNTVTRGKQDQISARTIVIPNNVFAAYEPLAVRLWNTPAGSEVPVYVVPGAEIKVTVDAVTSETLKGPAGALATRRFDLTLQNPGRPTKAALVVDQHLRLVRFEIPEIGLQVVREDAASVAVRSEAARNPTDSDVTVPANGFNLAGTLTLPPTVAGRLRHPAVLLVGGTSPADRDELVAGVPMFTQLARALADAGNVVLRYDRRGNGQSGGRTDTAALPDYADDAASAVKWLANRDDVDTRRIVVVGHMDGDPVALLAAAASKEIDGVVTIDAASVSGAELILLQQQKLLATLNLSDSDRQAQVDLQKKIQAAVVSGSGWEGVPPAMRRQADTPWFKSLLTYDPAKVLPKVRQPMLILHDDHDPTVPPGEADRLGALAKARKKAGPAEVVHIAAAGNTVASAGFAQLTGRIADAIIEWIKKL
jgi:pimeloyl-ACP methyl ester carboxylesterase